MRSGEEIEFSLPIQNKKGNEKMCIQEDPKLQEVLKENGIDKIKFYHHKTPIGYAYTCCSLFDIERSEIANGISICSLKDQFNKEDGRNKSFQRAYLALKNKQNIGYINCIDHKTKLPRFYGQLVNRFFKIKNSTDEEKFNFEIKPFIISKLNEVNRPIEYFKKIKEDDGSKSILFKLPLNSFLIEACKEFEFKGNYYGSKPSDSSPPFEV